MKEEKELKVKKTPTKKTTAKKTVTKKSTVAKKETEAKPKKVATSTAKKTTTAKKATTPKKETVKKEVKKEVEKQEQIIEKEPVEVKVEKSEVKTSPEIKEVKHEKIGISFDNPISILGIILACILIIVLSIQFYMKMRSEIYSSYFIDKSYLVEHNLANQVNCDALGEALKGKNSFILLTNYSEQAFDLEKDISDLIKKNQLEDYFHVYPLIDNCGPISDKNSVAGLNLNLPFGIDKTPSILYYQDGKLMDVIKREDSQMLSKADFQQFLDIYELNKEE